MVLMEYFNVTVNYNMTVIFTLDAVYVMISGDFYPNFGKLQPGCLEKFKLPVFGVNVGIPAPLRSFGNTIGMIQFILIFH